MENENVYMDWNNPYKENHFPDMETVSFKLKRGILAKNRPKKRLHALLGMVQWCTVRKHLRY